MQWCCYQLLDNPRLDLSMAAPWTVLIFPLFLLHTTLASYGQLRLVLSPYIVVYVLAVVGRVR